MDPAAYGDAAAALYDDDFAPSPQAGVVEFLVGLAGGGSVLDVGAGTGRVAIPLARAGCQVTAVDVSERMCAVLRSKSAGLDIICLQQDVTQDRPPGRHELAICLFNTFFMLGDSAAQARAFHLLADSLSSDGRLVIEAFLPDVGRFGPRGEFCRLRSVTTDQVVLQFCMHDPETSRIVGQDVVLRPGEVRLIPSVMHYLWPADLDEMAVSSGLELERRCSDWQWDRPVDESTANVISLYRKVRP
jgi:SAM-dependent methyltransferase